MRQPKVALDIRFSRLATDSGAADPIGLQFVDDDENLRKRAPVLLQTRRCSQAGYRDHELCGGERGNNAIDR